MFNFSAYRRLGRESFSCIDKNFVKGDAGCSTPCACKNLSFSPNRHRHRRRFFFTPTGTCAVSTLCVKIFFVSS